VKKILFLGYNESQTCLIKELRNVKIHVDSTSEKINSVKSYDLIISFGYKHIIDAEFLNLIDIPVINLHISFLPWNRGAHPNFWSFYENSPKGVTIHLIDEGIDTGPIIYQKIVNFTENDETFEQTYSVLKREIESLFISNLIPIVSGKYNIRSQCGEGSFHKKSDLPEDFRGWNAKIIPEINRLKNIKN
tara:strand:+ start:170 stop:739 length:570 start_codon:yes stop_codon:yes gene_type:complete